MVGKCLYPTLFIFRSAGEVKEIPKSQPSVLQSFFIEKLSKETYFFLAIHFTFLC
jgi:hypothetical protein